MTNPHDDTPVGWKPIAVTDEVYEQMNKEAPDVSWLRRWMLANYAAQSGAQIQPETATPTQLAELARWLIFQEMNGGTGALRRRWRRLEHILHGDYSGKVGAISRRHCFMCHGGRPADDLFPVSKHTVRITPISRQASESKPGTFNAFQAAFVKRFSEHPVDIGKTGRLCIALTFVLSARKPDRDVDNMSKAILDAFSRAVGFNDRFVHHLDVVKLIFPCTEEYVFIRIAPSALNEHGDVVAPGFHHSWAGMQPIELADYMPPAGGDEQAAPRVRKRVRRRRGPRRPT